METDGDDTRSRTDKEEEAEDDGHQRQGTLWTGTSHVVTAVIGSGVLALPWSVAQLGWVAGPIVLVFFSAVTLYTSCLLADCYRYPLPDSGRRNRTYMAAVRSYLGPKEVLLCGIAQYLNLWGTMVGYTITSTISLKVICRESRRWNTASFTLVFGAIQVVLSQFPSLEKITWISIIAAFMSFAYSTIALFLCIVKWVENGGIRGTLAGAPAPSPVGKTWMLLQALGNIAFAYTYSEVLIEIQDTLRSPPAESRTMKKVAACGVGVTTIFYVLLGSIGYAAFGDGVPGNLLGSSGVFRPPWVVEVGNMCIAIHLVGAYQVFAQPIFAGLEKEMGERWPESRFLHELPLPVGGAKPVRLTVGKVLLRSAVIGATTLVALLLPFFNAVLGLFGAMSFWPLTVCLPVLMHLAQRRIPRCTPKWLLLQALNGVCLVVSLLATVGSVADIVGSLGKPSPF